MDEPFTPTPPEPLEDFRITKLKDDYFAVAMGADGYWLTYQISTAQLRVIGEKIEEALKGQ